MPETDTYDKLILDLTQKELDDEIERFRNIKNRAADFVQINLVVAGVLATVLSVVVGQKIPLTDLQKSLMGLGLLLLIVSVILSLVGVVPRRLKSLDTATFDRKHRSEESTEQMDYLIGTLADLVSKAQTETDKLAKTQLTSYFFLTFGVIAIFIMLLTFAQ